MANDISNSRAKGLLKNIELFGIRKYAGARGAGKLKYFAEYFDKILIDAPCSGEGMFRKDRKRWSKHGKSMVRSFSQKFSEVSSRRRHPCCVRVE